MVYVSGDNNLEDYVVKDLELELGGAGSNADVQILALADRGPGYDKSRGDWQTTKLFHVTPGMTADAASAVADWGERNMGDKQTLVDFVNWSKANYPADHYALYFWGHGWSWHPGWVMEDDTSNDTLDYDETKAAISSLGFMDVVGYDGCNMASLEIMDLWHGHATAITGSQEYVGWDGLEYDVFLKQLKLNPAMSADQLAINSQRVGGHRPDLVGRGRRQPDERPGDRGRPVGRCVAVRAGRQQEGLQQRLRPGQVLLAGADGQGPLRPRVKVNAKVTDATIRARGTAVMNAFSSVVLHERHVSQQAGSHGITIYGPAAKNQKTDFAYYRTLDLSAHTRWDEFLAAFVP